MHPGHGEPGGHGFPSDVSGGNGGDLRGRNGEGVRGVRAAPRGPLPAQTPRGPPETPRGVVSTGSHTPAHRLPRDRDSPHPVPPPSSRGLSPPAPGGGVGVEGVSPPTPTGSLPSGPGPPSYSPPPRRPSQPRGQGRRHRVPDGRKFPSELTRAQRTMATVVAPRPSASAGAGLQLPGTPGARRAPPLPGGGHLVGATRGTRRSRGDREESLHPCHPPPPPRRGSGAKEHLRGKGGGDRYNARPQSPNDPCVGGDAGQGGKGCPAAPRASTRAVNRKSEQEGAGRRLCRKCPVG